MMEPTDEATKWRLRERALTVAVGVWSLAVGLLLAFRPGVIESLLARHPMTVGSVILVSIGVFGFLGHMSLLLVWSNRRDYSDDLTEWDGIE